MQLRSDFTVMLIDAMGDDASITRAAKVSVDAGASLGAQESAGLIRYLMTHRHGSPFEHTSMTFYIEAPIFVWREFMRHRVGFSYNEASARYRELDPVFYLPSPERDLVRVSSPARPLFEHGSPEQHALTRSEHERSYHQGWQSYRAMLDAGIASEVARSVLPVGIYSGAYVTCNARSLMAFLSLRTHDLEAGFVSWPQKEIDDVARAMEVVFAERFRLTHAAFTGAGRVSP